jgi:dTDP-4-amino-4,6-dideoxygalactose transaminase
LDEIQAAVLRVKLPRLDADNQRRNEIARYYLNNINHPDIILPKSECAVPENNSPEVKEGIDEHLINPQYKAHIWHVFVIRYRDRDKLQKYLADNGIQTIIHYPIPPHKQSAYTEWNRYSLPITELIHNEVLSLPMSPLLSMAEAQLVVDAINNYAR